MNARYGWFWSYSTDGDSQRFNREFWDAVFDEDMPEIGRANQDSKEDNLHIIGRSCIRWCYYQLNLFGDPSLAFFKDSHAHPDIEIGDVAGGFGVEAMIKNTGDADATGVEWTITVTGGIFDLINKTFSGTIQELAVDEEATVNSNIFLALGPIKIAITAECNEGSFTDKTAEGTQLLFFTKIL
ncbi:MAG: C25 family cysteine peptidase, partial [Candidatus Thermoplasmatota archaeon]|nr:C25 family cysteine peptidase [Candidatus Thermoplasmatota archaeon]